MEIKLKLLGKNNISVATTFNNFGLLYKAAGKYDLAEKFFLESLEIR